MSAETPTHKIQLGSAPAEHVTDQQLADLKARYGAMFSQYTVTQIQPAKPADAAAPDKAKRA